MTRIAIYVAVARNGVIGSGGGMPWKLSSDLKRFKAGTMGKPIVMGRKTFESIGRPLPGRLNIVVTRDANWRADGVETAGSVEDALALARARAGQMADVDEIAVIGGGQIYAQALPLADRVYLTWVMAAPDGDTVFPSLDEAQWREVSCEDFQAGERDSHATRYCIYDRVAPFADR